MTPFHSLGLIGRTFGTFFRAVAASNRAPPFHGAEIAAHGACFPVFRRYESGATGASRQKKPRIAPGRDTRNSADTILPLWVAGQVFWLADPSNATPSHPDAGRAVAFCGVSPCSQRRSNATELHRIPFSPFARRKAPQQHCGHLIQPQTNCNGLSLPSPLCSQSHGARHFTRMGPWPKTSPEW